MFAPGHKQRNKIYLLKKQPKEIFILLMEGNIYHNQKSKSWVCGKAMTKHVLLSNRVVWQVWQYIVPQFLS
jgi:hypothetical protein